MRGGALILAAAVACATVAAIPPGARAQDAPPPVRLLDVPYIPQSEALCGGAAAAMVMRYFGAPDVHADAFADLVNPDAGGIRGEDLIARMRALKWQAASFKGDPALVQSHLGARRPVIALIEDRPGRFHYVVIVAWVGERVVLHDPARAPFRVMQEPEFLRAWHASGDWSLVALPKGGAARDTAQTTASIEAVADTPEPGDSCGRMVAEGVRLAATGDLDGAERLLVLARDACPARSGPWRERAGLRVLRQDWPVAVAYAREALARDPSDAHAARILATSLFLSGDGDGALRAWNRLGEPTIDLVDVEGLERTRYDVAARTLGLERRMTLTPQNLQEARRRLGEMPSAAATRVFYTPGEGGRANVEAAIVERPFVPWGVVPLAAIGVRAAIDRELSAGIASPTGGGELFTVAWRWWEHRPRVAVSLSAPSPTRLLGSVWSVEFFDERQTYFAGREIVEDRRRAALTAADWISPRVRWQASAGVDRWDGLGTSLALDGRIDTHLRSDRLIVGVRGAVWAGGVRTATAGASIDWRSRTAPEGHVWLAGAGVAVAAESAPLALWPGAGGGHGRDALLRGHRLLHDGIIRNGVFGRRLLHATGEWRYWIRPASRPWRIAPAIFADVARAGRSMTGFDLRTHVDVGGGIRLAIPGGGSIRVDLASSLRDGGARISAAFTR